MSNNVICITHNIVNKMMLQIRRYAYLSRHIILPQLIAPSILTFHRKKSPGVTNNIGFPAVTCQDVSGEKRPIRDDTGAFDHT